MSACCLFPSLNPIWKSRATRSVPVKWIRLLVWGMLFLGGHFFGGILDVGNLAGIVFSVLSQSPETSSFMCVCFFTINLKIEMAISFYTSLWVGISLMCHYWTENFLFDFYSIHCLYHTLITCYFLYRSVYCLDDFFPLNDGLSLDWLLQILFSAPFSGRQLPPDIFVFLSSVNLAAHCSVSITYQYSQTKPNIKFTYPMDRTCPKYNSRVVVGQKTSYCCEKERIRPTVNNNAMLQFNDVIVCGGTKATDNQLQSDYNACSMIP